MIKKARKIILWLVFLYFLGIAAIWFDGATTGYEKSEYAVVLGNQVYPSGEPSERLKARLERAAELFRDGTVQKIIVSGGLGKEGHDEAVVMKQYLETQCIPTVAVIADSYGNNTHLTARNAKQWANTAKPIIVVSSFTMCHAQQWRLSKRVSHKSVQPTQIILKEGTCMLRYVNYSRGSAIGSEYANDEYVEKTPENPPLAHRRRCVADRANTCRLLPLFRHPNAEKFCQTGSGDILRLRNWRPLANDNAIRKSSFSTAWSICCN
ncbi:YdcF family protein [Thiothrix subterranea]|uniref:YdcF family protein n=1 Tax=Thiothrix subterranea TaxID=2735563 RepID=UPI00280BAE94|nr:YdcF family protein [Thiothrix subterranea]